MTLYVGGGLFIFDSQLVASELFRNLGTRCRFTSYEHGRGGFHTNAQDYQKGEVLQTLDIKLTFVQELWLDELTVRCHDSLCRTITFI